jgi:hypothetical protein
MDTIKAFFAKDWVKIVFGGLYFVGNALLLSVIPEGALKNTLLTIYLGITSGGTSGLRNDVSNSVTSQLAAKGEVKVTK